MTNEFVHSIELEGQGFTRRSYRRYTHVIVGRVDIARLRAVAATVMRNDPETAEHFAQEVFGFAGETNKQRAIDDGWTSEVWANLNHMIAQRVAHAEKQISDGAGKLAVLQWSMSEKNARNALRTIAKRSYYVDLAVLPVASRVPATKRQA